MDDYDPNWYDRDGNVIDEAKAALLMEHAPYRFVKKTAITSACNSSATLEVSTIWLGRNHGTRQEPLIFESLILAPGMRDIEGRRYGTLKEAMRGHGELVSVAKEYFNKPYVVDVTP